MTMDLDLVVRSGEFCDRELNSDVSATLQGKKKVSAIVTRVIAK